MDTPTPRTDAVMLAPSHRNYALQYVPADFARTLERELAAAKEQLKARDENAAMLEAKLDAIAKELGHPAGAWKIAGCDVLAHYVRDTVANCRRFYESADTAQNQLRDLITLCKNNGMDVTVFECAARSPLKASDTGTEISRTEKCSHERR